MPSRLPSLPPDIKTYLKNFTINKDIFFGINKELLVIETGVTIVLFEVIAIFYHLHQKLYLTIRTNPWS